MLTPGLYSYDPEYEAFEFGKISALREIALALETPHQYYFMGKPLFSLTRRKQKAD